MGEHSASRRPVKKVTAAAAAGAAVTLVIAGLGLVGVKVSPEVASALDTVAMFAAAYLKSA